MKFIYQQMRRLLFLFSPFYFEIPSISLFDTNAIIRLKDMKIWIIIIIIAIITVLFIFKRRKIISYDTLKRIVNPLSDTFTSSSYVKWSYLHPSDIIDRALLPCHQPLRKLNIHSLPKKFPLALIETTIHAEFCYIFLKKYQKVWIASSLVCFFRYIKCVNVIYEA